MFYLYSNYTNMDKYEFEMIQDAMNAIKCNEAEDYIINFQGHFARSDAPEVMNIGKSITYTGHSGASFALTLRSCQYYLIHPEEWRQICRVNQGSP